MVRRLALLFLSLTLTACLQDQEQTNDITEQGVTPAEDSFYLPKQDAMDISDYRDDDFLSIARSAIQAHEERVSYSRWFKPFHAHASTVQCGAVITSNVTVSGTLDCTRHPGKYALVIYGKNAKLDGGKNKFKLIFPQGKVGILVYGEKAEVENVVVNDMTNGMGILLYDSDRGEVKNSTANRNLIGITAYAEHITMNQPEIEGNTATDNALFGIRLNSAWSSGKMVANPKIHNNDLSGSGYYALHARTDNLAFTDKQNVNEMTGSENGWYLTGGNFQFEKVNAGTDIEKTVIFVAEANNLSLNNVKLTGNGGTKDQESYGLHTYRVVNTNVNNSEFKNFDVGVKIASENLLNSVANISSGKIIDNTYAGLIMQNYDGNGVLSSNVNNVSYNGNGAYNVLCYGVYGSFCNN